MNTDSFTSHDFGTSTRDQALAALRRLHERAARMHVPYAIILFSVDRFRLINARFGYDAADRLLARVAQAAAAELGETAHVYRLGGDEFLALLPERNSRDAHQQATQLRQRLNQLVITMEGGITTITCSFGVTSFPDNGIELRTLMMTAEEALLQAKRSGRDRVVAASGSEPTLHRLGDLLETAIREDRIMPAYQPIYDLESETLVGEEALARIITTDERVLVAQDFIEAASALELTHKVDRAIIAAALRRRAESLAAGAPRTIFANVSGSLLRHPQIVRELFQSGLPHSTRAASSRGALVIEITERELLADPRGVRQLLAPFLEMGLQLALDDFGSGYSSFQYLADLPVSYVKIDGRLIQRLREPRVHKILSGIQRIAVDLGVTTLAEYVETREQAMDLREVGINWAQGHYFSRAQMDELEASRRRQMSVNWSHGYYYRPN